MLLPVYTPEHQLQAVKLMAKLLKPTKYSKEAALLTAIQLSVEMEPADVLEARSVVAAKDYSLEECTAYAEGIALSYILCYLLYMSQQVDRYALSQLVQLLIAACVRCVELEEQQEQQEQQEQE